MIRSRDFPDSRTISSVVRCSVSSLVRARSSTMPRTPFIGVLISWLMVARNVLLARLAASTSAARFPALRSVSGSRAAFLFVP